MPSYAAYLTKTHSLQYAAPTCSDTAVLLCHFNPSNSAKLLENFNATCARLKSSNIPYYAVELQYGDQPRATEATFALQCPTPMFHKECLWNWLAARVPEQYTKLIFIDADMLFSAPDWVDRCSAALDTADLMQPMSACVNAGVRPFPSFAATLVKAFQLGQYRHSVRGHTGYAVAVRREWWQQFQFFAELFGAGDCRFWFAVEFALRHSRPRFNFLQVGWLALKAALWCDRPGRNFLQAFWFAAQDARHHRRPGSKASVVSRQAKPDVRAYEEKIAQLPPRIAALDGVTAYHLPHGVKIYRRYATRYREFDPKDFESVSRTADGIPYWPAGSVPAKKSQRYFDERREDGHPRMRDYLREQWRNFSCDAVPIYCISLQRAKQRRAQMIADWQVARGVRFSFFDAVDKRDLNPASRRDGGLLDYDPDRALALIGRELSIGERACRLSHFLCAQKLLRRYPDAPFYVVIEDDATPLFINREDFFRRAVYGFYEQSGVDALLAHNMHGQFKLQNTQFFSCRVALDRAYRGPWGSICVIFSRAGLEQYCAELMKPQPADWWLGWPSTAHVSCLINNLAQHAGDETYIGNELRGTKRIEIG